jgi:hypothetical protein
MKLQNRLTVSRKPREVLGWEGELRFFKSRELQKTLFSHGYEVELVSAEDLISCLIQSDPTKHQRQNCAALTNQGIRKLSDKIVDLAQF